jgi:hypothetical protein
MKTLTVRFEPNESSQTELLKELGRAVDALKKRGIVSVAEVGPAFPGNESGKYKDTFTVSFIGTADRVQEALNKLSGVRDAYVTPQRAAV